MARTSALLAAAKFKIIPFLEVGEGSLPVRRSEKLKLGEVYIGAPTMFCFFSHFMKIMTSVDQGGHPKDPKGYTVPG